jgi:hypothetical protein
VRVYRSPDEDSSRWQQFRWRDGDIVISTRSKHGTTWMQMICALLIFGTAELPAPLPRLSPWVDWLGLSMDELMQRLEVQEHRRFVKTHTPLDGVPIYPGTTYIVVARNPLDAAVSLYHQGDNLDRHKMHELTGAPLPTKPRPPLRDWLLEWIEADPEPAEELDSLPGVMWHLRDAWERRNEPNVILTHYADLSGNLDGEMRRLAERLDIAIDENRWPHLVRAATFDDMRRRADEIVPAMGVLKSSQAFFRRGGSGAAAAVLTSDKLRRYDERIATLASRDLLAWLNR